MIEIRQEREKIIRDAGRIEKKCEWKDTVLDNKISVNYNKTHEWHCREKSIVGTVFHLGIQNGSNNKNIP